MTKEQCPIFWAGQWKGLAPFMFTCVSVPHPLRWQGANDLACPERVWEHTPVSWALDSCSWVFFKLDVFHLYTYEGIDSLLPLERYLLTIRLWVQNTVVVLCRDLIGVVAMRREEVWSQIYLKWNPNPFSVALWPWSCYFISLKIWSSFNFSTPGKGIPFWS